MAPKFQNHDTDRDLTEQEHHRKLWLQHALQTPAPYRKTKRENLLAGILAYLKKCS